MLEHRDQFCTKISLDIQQQNAQIINKVQCECLE
jgi:hypothetical protein